MTIIKHIEDQILTGERALFMSRNLTLSHTTFEDGESPLKESQNIVLDHTKFKWKYPLWYCQDIRLSDSALWETARSGIWYTHRIRIERTQIDAPKTFRRSGDIHLKDVNMPHAEETLWSCQDIYMENVQVSGDYFGKDCDGVEADGLVVNGNYCFDGASNVVIRNARLVSKDAFWNCENVTVYDSYIEGEYLGWNSKNMTFINCTIESEQGLCYIENLVMRDCELVNTTLVFEYCTLDVEINSVVMSIKNPISGHMSVKGIGTLILDDHNLDHSKLNIEVEGKPYEI